MQEMIASRRTGEHKEARDDLLSGLLDACESDLDGSSKLTDRELLGTFCAPPCRLGTHLDWLSV